LGGYYRKLKRAFPLACFAPIAPSAEAGAWSLPEGVQQWLATISRETGDFGEAWRADDFTEIGLGDGWALNFKVESEIRINTTFDDRSGARIGLQKAFPIGERGSIAFMASALVGESLDGIDCEGEGYEVRAAAGTSFNLWGREGFVNAEAGHRARGDCTRDVGEVAVGLNFAPDWHVNLKAWSEGGGETGVANVEASVMHDFWGIGVGVGWREEISGNFEEKGWVLNGRMRF
jgi:hypothetical protein